MAGYSYSKKYYVSDEQLECRKSENANILISNFGIDDSTYLLDPIFKCRVVFRIHNLSNKVITTRYTAKNYDFKPRSVFFNADTHIPRSDMHVGFFESGSVHLKPKQTKLIKLEVETRFNYKNLMINTRISDKSI